MAIGAIIYRVGGCQIENLKGLGRQMPLTFGAIVIGGLSLIGVPGTAGFVSKWYLVIAALEQQNWIVVAVILAGSLLALIYVGKILEALYFQQAGVENTGVSEAPLLLLIPTWALALANVYFGFDTDLSVGVAEKAAQALGAVAK